MDKTVLVLGARGRLGGAVAQAFAAAGWRVLAQRRAGGAAPAPAAGIEWLQADATNIAAVRQAAAGAQVVVHAMNPAYTAAAWRAEAPGLMQAAIDLAAALGAHLLFPGNVYNFGADMPPVLAPDTPQRPGTVQGRVRVELEQQLAQAARQHGLAATVIRAGDFFGAGSGSWLDTVIANKLPQGRVTWPGALDTPHAWAYLPDLARAFVRVAEAGGMPGTCDTLHFAGHTATGAEWLAELTEVAWERGWLPRTGALRTGRLPWGLMRLAAPLVPMAASLVAMRYLWEVPHALDGAALARRIGAEPYTPFAEAVRAAMAAQHPAAQGVGRPAVPVRRPTTQEA